MSSWEEELAVLLRELGVKQEEPKSSLQSTRKPARSDVRRCELLADELLDEKKGEEMEDDSEVQDLASMRREVDSIVSQVILLMQRGDLEVSIKEDVMVVLRALRRRLPTSNGVLHLVSSEEAYLESATALLHFCRLALQLSESATEDENA